MPGRPLEAAQPPAAGAPRRRIELAEDVSEERHVRIAELAVATTEGALLSAVGLGSCIGVALLHPPSGTVAMAHVFLPASEGRTEVAATTPGKFADTAIPALLELVAGAARGARPSSLQAVLVGGGQMFRLGGLADSSDVGGRNLAAVQEALAAAGVPVVATDVGGSQGRTARVYAGSCTVTSQVVGMGEVKIHEARAATRLRAA
jgi:chemotaxis protein CheD